MSRIPLTEQILPQHQEELERQSYRIVGNHSAVKVCEWTRKMINNEGGCYKYTFYGIRSHQCLQMTTSMFCASRCTFCWRGTKAPVAKEWYGPIDDPEHIIHHAIDAHLQLLIGFKGSSKANPHLYNESTQVRHVALSLTGEPITYPRINEILEAFHKREISTFLVTNAQFPEQIKKIKACTQLYLSIDAPDKQTLKIIDRPLFPDYWERMQECLDLLRDLPFRTCIRLTCVKGVNMTNPQGYATLIRKGLPQFIEVKAYVHVGSSRENLRRENMPLIEEVEQFTQELLNHLPEYERIKVHKPSRVVLLARKDVQKKCWINFPKFFSTVNSGKALQATSYNSEILCPNH
jgi:tRNA wybutosine-synthesizing protein 1